MPLQYEEIWHLLTLVDITETGHTRGTGLLRNQQRNFETVQQVIGMLTQPFGIGPPSSYKWGKVHRRFKDTGTVWGEVHDFTQEMLADLNVWLWRFGIEREGVFDLHEKFDGKNLLNAFENVPVITGLTENAVLQPPVFSISPKLQNVLLICETRR